MSLFGISCRLLKAGSRRYFSAEPQSNLPFVCLIMGPPGGGKGTISKKILRDFKFSHLSTGDSLRAHVNNNTPLGQEAKSFMESGKLVPDDLIVRLVLGDVKNGESQNLLLDGFPRTVAQAEALASSLKVNAVLCLDVPTDTILSRIARRWIHPQSGRTYADDYQPPKVAGVDDVTGEPLVQRDDDNQVDTVRQRLESYAEMTAPLVEYYQAQDVLKVFQGTESDVIYPMIKAHLKNLNL